MARPATGTNPAFVGGYVTDAQRDRLRALAALRGQSVNRLLADLIDHAVGAAADAPLAPAGKHIRFPVWIPESEQPLAPAGKHNRAVTVLADGGAAVA